MPLAKIIGIFPAPAAGLIWDSGNIEFVFDPQWSDGNARSINPVRGILHPTLKNRFVAPSSLGDLFVPATPTGVGVVAGPPVVMRWEMVSSDGQRYRGEVNFQTLLANASNEWNVNQQSVNPSFVTSAGPDPVGLTVAAGDARYPLRTDIIAAAQIGGHAARHAPGGADPLSSFGSAAFAAPSGITFLEFGRGATDTPYLDFHTSGTNLDYDVRFYFYGGDGVTLGGGSLDISALVFRLNGSQIVNEANMTARNNLATLPSAAPTLAWVGGVGSQANVIVLDTTPVIVDAKEVIYKITANFAVAGTVQINAAFTSAGWTLIDADIGANRQSNPIPHPNVSRVRHGALITFSDTLGQIEAVIRIRRSA